MARGTDQVVVVIPCFNEEQRFASARFAELFEHDRIGALVVDDGSSDGTLAVLEAFAAEFPQRAEALSLGTNRGKAEAVRSGMNHAMANGADIVGYLDADLATPVSEIVRMVEILDTTDYTTVIGSRIARMGATIKRRATRHYIGRVFATAASLILREQIYDTQCGAKMFRCTEALREALADPFSSRWAFDVELLGRILMRDDRLFELPLEVWEDIPGSKMSMGNMVRAGLDLVQINRALNRRRNDQ